MISVEFYDFNKKDAPLCDRNFYNRVMSILRKEILRLEDNLSITNKKSEIKTLKSNIEELYNLQNKILCSDDESDSFIELIVNYIYIWHGFDMNYKGNFNIKSIFNIGDSIFLNVSVDDNTYLFKIINNKKIDFGEIFKSE